MSERTAAAIQVTDLVRSFGARKALDGLSFQLPAGAFLSIFGPNGAGKTTLLRILATLTAPSKGTAQVFGYDVVKDSVELRRRIGIISHNPLLYPDLSAAENLAFFADLYCLENPQARIDELLSAVELKHRRYDLVRTFSRGMTQRLSIARALLPEPDVLFLDEPYSGLDPHASDILDGLIRSVRDRYTFVMVSHDLDKGLELASDVLILARGKKVLYQQTADLDREAFRTLYRETVGLGVS
ncbi:MAG: ABC transporter ATP-binding protein [Actinomycetes bacterium]|jgi:heme exporter protein A|nr:ABC transporter ATP-binding protein [Actinomycetes bacterium]